METIEELVEHLQWIVDNPEEVEDYADYIAECGRQLTQLADKQWERSLFP